MSKSELIENKLNWKIIVFLSGILWMITSSSRMILSPLMGLLKLEWNLSASEIGLVGSIIYLPYLLFQIPSGILADRWSRKNMLIWGGILQGVSIVGCAFSTNVFVFSIFRALTGLFSATIFSSLYGYLSNIIPVDKKFVGIAAINFFIPLGVIIGSVVTSEIVFRQQKSWGYPFLIFGITIIIFSAMLAYYTRKQYSKDYPEISKDKDTSQDTSLISYLKYIGKFIKNRNLLFLSLICFIQSYTLFNMFTWLPYLLSTKGFSALEAGNFSSFAYFLSIPTTIIITLKVNLNTNIKRLVVIFMIINIVSMFFIITVKSISILIVLFIVYGLTCRLSTTPFHIHMVTEASSALNYSKDLSIYNTFSCVAMLVAPIVTGYLYDLTNSIEAGFFVTIFLEVIAIFMMSFGIITGHKIENKNIVATNIAG